MTIVKLDPLDRPLRGHKQIAEFTGESLQAVGTSSPKKSSGPGKSAVSGTPPRAP
jgi:hypothetical protein